MIVIITNTIVFQEMKDIEDSKKLGKRKKRQDDNEDDDTEQSMGVRKRIKGKNKGRGKKG